jgi:hypothetical protein
MTAAARTCGDNRRINRGALLRCAGYELLDLRAEGSRKVFVFQDRPTRRNDVIAFYGECPSRPPVPKLWRQASPVAM